MPRGMTLIELTISLVVISSLLLAAAPSWKGFVDRYQAKSLASDLQGVFAMAKNEAIVRNKDLWIHFYKVLQDGEVVWTITINRSRYSSADAHLAMSNALFMSEGKTAFMSANWRTIKVIGFNGKFSQAGHILFSVNISKVPSLKLVFHNVTGRVRICSVGANYYDYLKC